MEQEQNEMQPEKKSGMNYAVMGIIVAIILIVGIVVFAKSRKSSQPSANKPANTSTQKSSSATQNKSSDAIVTFSDSGFSPQSVTIKAGQTVEFKNDSSEGMWVASAAHPVHSDYDGTTLSQHCAPGATPSFDACQALTKGQSYFFTFEKTGTWKYHNHADPTKFGSITVQ